MAERVNNRIHLSRHKKEWKIIFKKIEELRTVQSKMTHEERISYFHNYVNKKMYSLSNDYKDCPDCVLDCLDKKIKMQHYVNKDLYKTFLEISERSTLPVATIVDKLIIAPLLIEK